MMNELNSVLNGSLSAGDNDSAYTYIEFLNNSGYTNTHADFLSSYQKYLIEWHNFKNANNSSEVDEIVFVEMVDLLKSITITYTSYEEQDYIANIDWDDKEQLKSIIPIYVRRIKEITSFYKKKREEAPLIVERDKIKGTSKYIEEILYERIINYIFNSQKYYVDIDNIKKYLNISIENYIDIYSNYFDIPRNELSDNKSREKFLSANINDINWKVFLQENSVISDIIFSGKVYLKQIPLIASIGLNLNEKCVGDKLALKNTLLKNTEMNLIPVDEQVSIKRSLYEKYLGVDLYYLYSDSDKNIKMDLMTKAKNPSANILNNRTADTATVESNDLILLKNIGLFFKPGKTSILKVNSKNHSWSIDESAILPDTIYIFPDPNKYGNIGTNKDEIYPFIMEYSHDYDIKNLSSGIASTDPLVLISDQSWNGYYSKQQDIFKHREYDNLNYSFSNLYNKGFVYNYKQDIYGNEFAIFKKGAFKRGIQLDTDNNSSENAGGNGKGILINGGYMEDPYYQGHWEEIEGHWKYISGRPFNYNKSFVISDSYYWSGIKMSNTFDNHKDSTLFISPILTKNFNYGEFGNNNFIKYEDHYGVTKKNVEFIDIDSEIYQNINEYFYSDLIDDDIDDNTLNRRDLLTQVGDIFVRNNETLDAKPLKLSEAMPWTDEHIDIIDFSIFNNVIILETIKEFIFYQFSYEDGVFKNPTGSNKKIKIEKQHFSSNIFYIENSKKCFVIALKALQIENGYKLSPTLFEVDLGAFVCQKTVYLSDDDSLKIDNFNLNDFFTLSSVKLSHSASLKKMVIVYISYDGNNTPTIHEHIFGYKNTEDFLDTLKTTIYKNTESANKYSKDLTCKTNFK